MTKEKLNEIIEEIKQKEISILNKAKELFESGELVLYKYKEIGAFNDKWGSWNHRYLTKVVEQTDCFSGLDENDIIQEIGKIKRLHRKTIGIDKSPLSMHKEVNDGYIYFFGCEFDYYKIDESRLEYEIEKETRSKIAKLLKPESEKTKKPVDCQMLKLFKDGVIDWKALQKIVYADCEV